MFFRPVKMTIELEDGRIVELDFDSRVSPVEFSSAPLVSNEMADLIFSVSKFMGAGAKAMVDPD